MRRAKCFGGKSVLTNTVFVGLTFTLLVLNTRERWRGSSYQLTAKDEQENHSQQRIKTSDGASNRNVLSTGEHSSADTKVCCVPPEMSGSPDTAGSPGIAGSAGVPGCSPPVVPRLVHVVWFHHENHTTFRFHHLVSLMSMLRYVRPHTLMFHGDSAPTGGWWRHFLREANNTELYVTKVKFMYRRMPTEIFGHPIKVYEHRTDVARHEILLEHGGIYTDLDVVFLRPLDPLMCHPMVMGEELRGWLTNGVMLAEPGAPFLRVWYDMYKDYFSEHAWNFVSVILPGMVWSEHPGLVHVEHTSMNHPTWEPHDLRRLYGEGAIYDWAPNYCVHLWYRKYNKDLDPETIKRLNSTVGHLFRLIYYGRADLILDTPAPPRDGTLYYKH